MARRSKSKAEKLAQRLERYPEALALADRSDGSEQLRRVVGLLSKGLNGIEISERLGMARSTVYDLLNDPHGTEAKARKAKGQRPCVDCGAPCNMDGRRSEPAERCLACARAKSEAEKKWKPEAILDAIRQWASKYGAPPKAIEWNAASPYVHPGYLRGGWPAWSTVAGAFGTFNVAVRAAGFKPYRELGGQPRKPLTRDQLSDTAALVRDHGLDRAAELLGLSVPGVQRRMKQHRKEPIKGGQRMPASLTAEAIIDRELEKHEAKRTRLSEELQETEKQAARLRLARRALDSDPEQVPAAA